MSTPVDTILKFIGPGSKRLQGGQLSEHMERRLCDSIGEHLGQSLAFVHPTDIVVWGIQDQICPGGGEGEENDDHSEF